MSRLLLIAILTCIGLSACGGTKVVIERPAGVRFYPPYAGKICQLSQPLPVEIPTEPVGVVRSRARSGEDPVDLLANIVRKSGGTVLYVVDQNRTRAVGHGFFVDPKFKLDCAAAGGQLR